MNEDFFDRLDAQLAGFARQGAHLPAETQARIRWQRRVRRGATSAAVVLALAASLVSEFPASAGGQVTQPAPWAAPQ